MIYNEFVMTYYVLTLNRTPFEKETTTRHHLQPGKPDCHNTVPVERNHLSTKVPPPSPFFRSIHIKFNFWVVSHGTGHASYRSPNDPSQTVQNHIRLLHDYNEIRDVGQGLLGLVADKRGVRYGDVLEEFGVEANDWLRVESNTYVLITSRLRVFHEGSYDYIQKRNVIINLLI